MQPRPAPFASSEPVSGLLSVLALKWTRHAAFALLSLMWACSATAQITYTERFDNIPGWETGWLKANSDLANYYGAGAGRGNNPDGLWVASATINFNSTFGATISSLQFGLQNHVPVTVMVYDSTSALIFSQAYSANSGGTVAGVNWPISVSSTRGISRIVLSGSSVPGNTGVDNFVVVTQTAGLKATYRFEEAAWSSGSTVYDNSGNGFNGTVTGTPTQSTTSPPNCSSKYGVFSGGSRLIMPYSATLNPASFTVAFWARVDGGQGTYRGPLTSRSVSPSITGYNLYAGVGNAWEFWTGNGGGFESFTGPAVTVGAWTHVAVSYQVTSGPDANGKYLGTGSMYINGNLASSRASLGYVRNTVSPLVIGSGGNGNTNFTDYPFNGALDEVRIYDKVLTAAEISALASTNTCPGGLGGAAWWSRADALSIADNSNIASWTNEVDSSKNLSPSPTAPKFRNNNAQNINFNPVVEFTSTTAGDSTAQYFSAASMLGSGSFNQAHYVYVGYPATASQTALPFHEATALVSGYTYGLLSSNWPWTGAVTWDAGTCCTNDRLSVSPTKLANAPAIYVLTKDSVSTPASGSGKQNLRQDGVVLSSNNTTTTSFAGINSSFRVGYPTNFGGIAGISAFRGVLAEGMLMLGSPMGAAETARVESYLGVKYGITLGGAASTATSYVASNGTTTWASNTGFHNNIVGLGRDDATKLNQLISRSSNAGNQITVTTAGTMPSTASVINATAGGNAFTANQSFILLGDNGLDPTLTTTIATGSFAGRQRSQRLWRVQVTGTPTQLSVCVPDAMFPAAFLAGGLSDVRLNLANVADMSGGNVAGATFTAETCVASGLGTSGSAAGRRATFTQATMASLTGGVAYMTMTRNAVDHIEVTASTATGVTCAPTTYTVKACSDAACTTPYTGGLSGTLTLTGAGVTASFPSGAAFTIAAGSSTTTVVGQVTTPSTATVGASGLSLTPANAKPVFCGLGVTANSTNACTMTVGSAGFLVSVPNHYAGASQAVSVRAVRSSDNAQVCLPAFANVTRTVKATCSYVNPSSGTVPVQLGAVRLNSGNTNSACDATGQNISLAFDVNGAASTTLSYWDAGRARLSLAYSGSAGTNDAGLSLTGMADFVAAPMGFIVTDHPSVATAGSPFSFNIKALAWGSNTNVLPNFGQESPREAVVLDWVRSEPLGSGAQAGSFTGSVGLFSSGVAAVSNASWSEVGRISPTVRLASGSYLSSGLNSAGNPLGITGWTFCANENGVCVIPSGLTAAIHYGVSAGAYIKTGQSGSVACNNSTFGDPWLGASKQCHYIALAGAGTTTTHIQVRPARLEVSAAAACGSFSYASQPFGVTVTAKNAQGQTTQNYAGMVARAVSLSDASGNSLGGLSGSVPASAFTLGVATLADIAPTAPVFSFNNKLTAPQTISLRATDSDGITSSGYDGSQTLRSGRLQMSNAFGGDKTSLQIPIQLQYWSGSSWVPNSADTCTVIPTASVVRARTLNHNNSTATWSSAISGISLTGGSGFITLGAPSPSGTGTVDLSINLGSSSTGQSCLAANPSSTGAGLPWLRSRQGNCVSTFDRDPSARATFGVYAPETQRSVHVREVF